MESNVEMELIERDGPTALAFLKEVKENADGVTASVKSLLSRLKGGEFKTSKGISFLELKCHMLLSYLINLTYVILQKSSGEKIKGDSTILRLTEIRTVLEKMRPIEQKLKYHIDKLVKASTGSLSENDPLRFRPLPGNMMNKLDDEEEDNSESESNKKTVEEKQSKKAYVPPKLAAMHYDGDLSLEDRKQKAFQQARKRALSSSIIQELKAEYYQGPEEIQESSSVYKRKESLEAQKRTEYEEEYFVRMNVSKKDQHSVKQLSRSSGLEKLTHFGDIRALTSEDKMEDSYGLPRKKRRAGKNFNKKHKKRKKF